MFDFPLADRCKGGEDHSQEEGEDSDERVLKSFTNAQANQLINLQDFALPKAGWEVGVWHVFLVQISCLFAVPIIHVPDTSLFDTCSVRLLSPLDMFPTHTNSGLVDGG